MCAGLVKTDGAEMCTYKAEVWVSDLQMHHETFIRLQPGSSSRHEHIYAVIKWERRDHLGPSNRLVFILLRLRRWWMWTWNHNLRTTPVLSFPSGSTWSKSCGPNRILLQHVKGVYVYSMAAIRRCAQLAAMLLPVSKRLRRASVGQVRCSALWLLQLFYLLNKQEYHSHLSLSYSTDFKNVYIFKCMRKTTSLMMIF